MARVKRAVNAHKKRRETLERASGYRGQRSRLYRKAKEQVTHSLVYAYADRRTRKGDFRRLWIQRINAGCRLNGMTYNRFIQGLKAAGVEVDRPCSLSPAPFGPKYNWWSVMTWYSRPPTMPNGTAQIATSVITPGRPPRATYRFPPHQTATTMPATMSRA